MQTKYTYKQIWLIAYPILISLLMEQLIGMTDTAFLGRVGEVELGASAIAGVFYMVIFMVASVSVSGPRYSLPGATANSSIRKSVTCSIRASISKSGWRQSCSCYPIVSHRLS